MMTTPGISPAGFSPKRAKSPKPFYDFERAIRLRPGSAPHLYDYALALARADRFDEAQERAEAAVRIDPNLAEAHELLGGLFERKAAIARGRARVPAGAGIAARFQPRALAIGQLCWPPRGTSPERPNTCARPPEASDAAIAQQAAQALRQLGAR